MATTKNEEKTGFEKVKNVRGLYKNVSIDKDGKKNTVFYVQLLWRQAGKGKSTWKSLKTNKLSTAKIRAKEEIGKHEDSQGLIDPEQRNWTMHQLYLSYVDFIKENPDMEENTRKARIANAKRLMRAMPEFRHQKVCSLRKNHCEEWARKLKTSRLGKPPPGSRQKAKLLSSSSINKSVGALSLMMQHGVSLGVIAQSPAEKLPLAKVKVEKKTELPTVENMNRLLVELEYPRSEKIISLTEATGATQADQAKSLGLSLATYKRHLAKQKKSPKPKNAGQGHNKDSADLARLMTYTGVRIGEACRLQWKHVNWERNQLHVPGTKSETSDRIIPLVPHASNFLQNLYQEHDPEPEERIAKRKDIRIFRRQLTLHATASA